MFLTRDDIVSKITFAHKRVFAGNDLVHLPTFENACTGHFIRRGYTISEIEYCNQFDNPTLRFASTWAGKEAVYKLVKQMDDSARLWWRGIEISRNKPQGKPSVAIAGVAQPDISLTITHDGDYVWAVAMCLAK